MKLKAITHALVITSLSLASVNAMSKTGVYSQITADNTVKSQLEAQNAAISAKIELQPRKRR